MCLGVLDYDYGAQLLSGVIYNAQCDQLNIVALRGERA